MSNNSKTVVILILISCCMVYNASGEHYDECDGADNESFVSYSQSCSAYIYCDGDDSIMDNCDEGQYFDGEMCDAKENVECALDDNEEGGDGEEVGDGEEGGGDEEETEAEPEEEQAPATTAKPATSTEAAAVTNATEPIDIPVDFLDIPPVVKDTCPSVDDPNQIVLIVNSNSCSDYYVCYHGHAIGMHCMDHLHFNAATGKCDFPENANCKLSVQAPSEFHKCLPNMSEFFPHPSKCNYFYYCIKGYQTLQQCPFYYGWDIEKRTCIHMSQAKCYNNNNP